MRDRIHRQLEGDVPADALTPAEREAAEVLRRTVDAAVGHLRSFPAPDLTDRVMSALPATPPARDAAWRTALRWLWRPRALRLRVRPAYALGGALAAIVAAGVLPRVDGEDAGHVSMDAATSAAPVVYVQFRLEARDARQVSLAGTFTGWQPTLRLAQTKPGVWTALVPLHPGVHDYVFVVDGTRWIPDPDAPQQVDDSFGGTNSRLSLPPLAASA